MWAANKHSAGCMFETPVRYALETESDQYVANP